MGNTIKNTTTLASKKDAIVYFTLSSDGSNETSTVLYDSSAVAASVGDTDTLDSTILDIYAVVSTGSTARVKLLWDASSAVLAFNLPAGTAQTDECFKDIGGLPNQAGAGITGDILITTTGLAAGDCITIVMTVRRD